MPRDASATREKLLRSAEHLFARHGVDGTLTRQIVTRAGQSNDSAIGYHFGSRRALLAEILDRHMRAIDQRQPQDCERARDLGGLVAAVTLPVSSELRSPEGRDFLRIIAQLAGDAGVRTHEMPNPLRDSVVAVQLGDLERTLTAALPEAVALERISMMIGMLTATLADRARRIDEKQPVLLEHDDFVANLVAMLTAALAAPDPAATRRV